MDGLGKLSVDVWKFFCFRRVDPLVYYMIQIWFFVFWVLFWFLIVVSGSVRTWFGILSMLSKVTFNVVYRDVVRETRLRMSFRLFF